MSAASIEDAAAQGKQCPAVLTDREIHQLMRSFCHGKTQIMEEDALTLVRWAHRVRMESLLLNMVLRGELVPSVVAGVVSLAWPGGQS
jgi:hypothetical protein